MSHSLVIPEREIREQIAQAEAVEDYIPVKLEVKHLKESISVRFAYPIEKYLRKNLSNVRSRVSKALRDGLHEQAHTLHNLFQKEQQKVFDFTKKKKG
jgi:hypothetical protein